MVEGEFSSFLGEEVEVNCYVLMIIQLMWRF